MPRNMSFALTTEQFTNRTKTVTRRTGWNALKPGDIVNGVKKSMGLKKGEKIQRLGQIRIVSIRRERIDAITPDDVVKEGFSDWTPAQFITFICRESNVKPNQLVNRIEFEYVENET